MAIKTKRLIYTARNFETGLTDVVAQIRRNGVQVGTNVALTEVGGGRYELVLTAATLAGYGGAGFYDYFINSALKSAPAISSGWILENDEDDLKADLDAKATKLNTIEGKIDDLDADLVAAKAVIDSSATNITSIKATVEDSNTEIKSPSHGLSILKGLIDSVSSSVSSIQNATRFVAAVPAQMIEPDAGSKAYRIPIRLYNGQGNLEDPDSNQIEVFVADELGASRKSYLSGFVDEGTPIYAVRDSLGAYHVDLAIPTGASIEQLNFSFDYVEGGIALSAVRSTHIVDESATQGMALESTLQEVLTDTSDMQPKVDIIKGLLEDATFGLSAIKTLVDTVNSNTDGVEGLLNDGTFGLSALKGLIDAKASQASVDNLQTSVNAKASQASVDALDTKLDTKSSQTSVDAVNSALDARLYLGGQAF
jgi:hypothetical protein